MQTSSMSILMEDQFEFAVLNTTPSYAKECEYIGKFARPKRLIPRSNCACWSSGPLFASPGSTYPPKSPLGDNWRPPLLYNSMGLMILWASELSIVLKGIPSPV